MQNKTADEIELPPEPQGKCPKALQVCQLDSGLLFALEMNICRGKTQKIMMNVVSISFNVNIRFMTTEKYL